MCVCIMAAWYHKVWIEHLANARCGEHKISGSIIKPLLFNIWSASGVIGWFAASSIILAFILSALDLFITLLICGAINAVTKGENICKSNYGFRGPYSKSLSLQ